MTEPTEPAVTSVFGSVLSLMEAKEDVRGSTAVDEEDVGLATEAAAAAVAAEEKFDDIRRGFLRCPNCEGIGIENARDNRGWLSIGDTRAAVSSGSVSVSILFVGVEF
jgi:hypothetical protein